METDLSTMPEPVNVGIQRMPIDPKFIKQALPGISGLGQSEQIGPLYHPDYGRLEPAEWMRSMTKRPLRTTSIPTVEVTKVGKTASAIVLCICLLSLALWLAHGFFFIAPIFSIVGVFFSLLFFALSVWCERLWNAS